MTDTSYLVHCCSCKREFHTLVADEEQCPDCRVEPSLQTDRLLSMSNWRTESRSFGGRLYDGNVMLNGWG